MDKEKQAIIQDNYEPPRIISEYQLETEAGSPLSMWPSDFNQDGIPDLNFPDE